MMSGEMHENVKVGYIKNNLTLSEALKTIIAHFDKQEKHIEELHMGLKQEVNDIRTRLDNVEYSPFDMSRTVCITGLKPKGNLPDDQYLEQIFSSMDLGGIIRNV